MPHHDSSLPGPFGRISVRRSARRITITASFERFKRKPPEESDPLGVPVEPIKPNDLSGGAMAELPADD